MNRGIGLIRPPGSLIRIDAALFGVPHREGTTQPLGFTGMGAHSPAWLVAGFALMGLFECDPYEWGSHAGKLCEGEELSLVPIAKGRNIAGWWTYVPPHPKAVPPLDHRFLFIDAGMRPRVWSEKGGEEYEKNGAYFRDWSFGCAAFIDHPLVVGAETRSPGEGRLTIGSGAGCSTAWRRGDPGSRRVLDSVYQSDGMLCLVYDTWRFNSRSVGNQGSGKALRRTICFGYDLSADQMLLAFQDGQEPLVTHRYQRHHGYQGTQSYSSDGTNVEIGLADDETGDPR